MSNAPEFPNYAPPTQPEGKYLMKAIRAGMKRATTKNRAMKRVLARPPGCKLRIVDDVKIKPKNNHDRNESRHIFY